MAKTKCDTDKMKTTGQAIVKETRELANLFDGLYTKLYGIQKEKIWLGLASNHFLEKTSKDKNEMMDFTKELQKYGQELIEFANKYQELADTYRRF
ncbi:MAG: hypothetical protein E7164_03590 [Firmicutes bacterium]|nr:hypothetical protein [Bacillota bacterium]